MFTTTNTTKWQQGFELNLNGVRYLRKVEEDGFCEDVEAEKAMGEHAEADATGVPDHPEVSDVVQKMRESFVATEQAQYPEGYGWGV